MTALADHLRRLVAVDGPMPVSRFMAEALTHPTLGYYASRDPFGRDGDFITAPEISQMFGELIGMWCAHGWQQLGQPSAFLLVELGPGRGTLMADAIRACRGVPGFLDAVDIRLVEVSPALREQQRNALAGIDITWHADIAELPDAPLLLIANEFFDALPIRQFQRHDDHWHERLINAGPAGLAYVLSPQPVADKLLPPAVRQAPPDSIVELSPARAGVMTEIAARMTAAGGLGLVVDYGYARTAPGDTLQAVKGHARHPVLQAPGTADITSHVDFQALTEAAVSAGAAAHGPLPQGRFLERLGIAARAAALSVKATPAQAAAIESATARLTGADQMGVLFKVLAVTSTNMPVPAGFEEETA